MEDCAETMVAFDRAMVQFAAGKEYVVTNGDLALKIRSLRADLALCNADKAALRQWKADTG